MPQVGLPFLHLPSVVATAVGPRDFVCLGLCTFKPHGCSCPFRNCSGLAINRPPAAPTAETAACGGCRPGISSPMGAKHRCCLAVAVAAAAAAPAAPRRQQRQRQQLRPVVVIHPDNSLHLCLEDLRHVPLGDGRGGGGSCNLGGRRSVGSWRQRPVALRSPLAGKAPPAAPPPAALLQQHQRKHPSANTLPLAGGCPVAS